MSTVQIPQRDLWGIGGSHDACARAQPWRACTGHTVGIGDKGALEPGVFAEIRPALLAKIFGAGAGRWARMGVDGSGSCFFHSLAAVLNYRGFLGLDLAGRRRVASEFRRSFVPLLNVTSGRDAAIRRQLLDDTAWAEQDTIVFVLRSLDVNIVFVDAAVGKIYCGVTGDRALKEVERGDMVDQESGVIMWANDHSHFEPVCRLSFAGGGAVGTFLLEPQFAESVMHSYVGTCSLATFKRR